MKRICVVTTSPLIVNFFLVPHLMHLSQTYEVTLMVNTAEEVQLPALPGVRVIPVAINRKLSPLADVRALVRLVALFSKLRFDLVQSISPKAGLLAMLASRIAGVRCRVHTFTGQVWVTAQGPMRLLLKAADRCIAWSATHVLADSSSQAAFLVAQRIVEPRKLRVLGAGSVSGVDIRRFEPSGRARSEVRQELAIPSQAVVLLFLGRITREKGVSELASAFAAEARKHSRAHLLLVGPDEDGLLPSVIATCSDCADRVHRVGYTREPERYVAAADILVLPSHREGFGTVVIEAAAAGLPAIASRIYGVTDALIDGHTGLLHEPGNAADLASQVDRLLSDEEFLRALGKQARARAVSEFPQARVTQLLLGFYQEILA